MDLKGFLPAHTQTKNQGTASGPHVLQGRHAGDEIDDQKASEAATGHEYTSPNNAASDPSHDTQPVGYSGTSQNDPYAGQGAGTSDPVQGSNLDAERGVEDTAAAAGAGTAAKQEEKHVHEKEPARQAAAASRAEKKHDDPVTRRKAAEQRELDSGKNAPAQNSYSSAPAAGATSERATGQDPYTQEEPSNRTREEEALGAGAAAGVGAGALAHHERKKDQYADQGMTGSDQRGPADTTNLDSMATGDDTLGSGPSSGGAAGRGAVAYSTLGRGDQDTYPTQGQSTGGASDTSNVGSSTHKDEALGAGAASGIATGAGAPGGLEPRGQDRYADQSQVTGDSNDVANVGSERKGEEALGAGAAAGLGGAATAGALGTRDQDPYSREGQVRGGPNDASDLGTSARGEEPLGAGEPSGIRAGTEAGAPATDERLGQDTYANQGQATGGLTNTANVGNTTGEGEALGAGTAAGLGAGAGAGAGALSEQGTRDGGVDTREGGLGSAGAGTGSDFERSAEHAPHISGDPDTGFTVDGQNVGSSGTAGVTGQQTGASQPSGTGGMTGSGTGDDQTLGSFKSQIAAIADERLFHGHHTTFTGEKLDPHIGNSGT